jgi:magnesium transporter
MSQGTPASSESLLESLAVIPGVRWFHLSDPSSPALDQLAAHLGIHPLQVEDCRHRNQTARVEEHDRYIFIVIKVLGPVADEQRPGRSRAASRDPQSRGGSATDSGGADIVDAHRSSDWGTRHLKFEDFDIFLGPDYVLTVSDGDSALVSSAAGRVRSEAVLNNPDRVTHALVDSAVDYYLPALDHIGDFINRLEDRVIRNPVPPTLREIFHLKLILLNFRRIATSMREVTNAMVRRYDVPRTGERGDVDRDLRFYYRDVYDHVVRVIDFIETYRDLLTGSMDIYLSAVANRTNEVMKILTLWGTIALPLLVLTSFYGMNIPLPFEHYRYALIPIGLIMLASSIVIFLYIRRKHWM